VDHTPRAEFFLELRIFGVVVRLRLLFGIEVIQVAEKLVEAVRRRQMLIAIAEMILAELASHIALLFE
jgi:hypothetical protein